jgi:L-threonylcarbamoyladenylate synthase
VEVYVPEPEERSPESLPSPGVGIRHYAPRARVVLVEGTPEALQRKVAELIAESPAAEKTAVLLPTGWPAPESAIVQPWAAWDEPQRLAATLFAGLRALDGRHVDRIVCPLPAPGGVHDAIRDRLLKAAREK